MITSVEGFAQTSNCSASVLGNISFDENSSIIPSGVADNLAAVADQVKNAPGCKIVVAGNAGGTKFSEELSWQRVYNTIGYLERNYGLDPNRFIFLLSTPTGDPNTVIVRGAAADEDGPSMVPEPHPGKR